MDGLDGVAPNGRAPAGGDSGLLPQSSMDAWDRAATDAGLNAGEAEDDGDGALHPSLPP